MTSFHSDRHVEELLTHAGWIRALARGLVRDPALADDIAQRTWITALEREPDGEKPLRQWLAAVARNFARQVLRSERRRATHEQRASRPEAQPSTSDVVERAAAQREVVEAVMELDEPYRTTILMRFFESQPPRAIARAMGVPVDTVNTRLKRGIARLRARLDRNHGGDRAAWLGALLPLVHAPLLPSTTVPGILLMNAKLKLVAAALALAAVIGVVFNWKHTATDAAPLAASDVRAHLEDGSREEARADLTLGASIEGSGASTRTSAIEPRAATASTTETASVALLHGKVLDARGAPVSAVRIGIATDSKLRDTPELATSASDGTFSAPAPRESGRLVALDKGLATVLSGVYSRGPGHTVPVVVIAPRRALAGTVVDEQGFPLKGAIVAFELPADFRTHFHDVLDASADIERMAFTDERGRFELLELARVDGSRVHASLEGFDAWSAPLDEIGAEIVITLARPRVTDGMLRGRVLDPSGTPVDGARVAVGVDTTRTERDGAFAFNLDDPSGFNARFKIPADEIKAIAKGFQIARWSPPTKDGKPDWPSFVTLKLGEKPLAIRGRVLGVDREGLAGAKVWVGDPTLFGAGQHGPQQVESILAGDEDTYWHSVTTDKEGRFEIEGLCEREYSLEAMDPSTLLRAQSGPVRAGASDVELRLPTDALFPRVAGRILSRKGAPVAGAHVYPMCDAFRARFRGQILGTAHDTLDGVTTDAQGRFEIANVPHSLVYLRIDGEDLIPLEYGRWVEGDRRFANTEVKALPKDKIESLEIAVELRCHFQVSLSDAATADELAVLDESGHELVINVFHGNSRQENERVPLHDGRSDPLAVSDAAHMLVLFKDKKEVLRKPIELAPGDMKEIQL